ncbi:MAG: hypothetical protein L6R41_004444 [Letrouitia leprolyta]|nr:MAG: hypothetical protein L6R41_004444 [Letrouitia leprolyta]
MREATSNPQQWGLFEGEGYSQVRSLLPSYDEDGGEYRNRDTEEVDEDHNSGGATAHGADDSRADDEEEDMILAGILESAISTRSLEHPRRSPLARIWPDAYLLPFSRLGARDRPSMMHLRKGGLSDGCYKILKVIQLLNLASQQPLEFKILREASHPAYAVGAPQLIFVNKY